MPESGQSEALLCMCSHKAQVPPATCFVVAVLSPEVATSIQDSLGDAED